MTRQPPPSALADKFMLRLPDGMRERIASKAKANNRSMNAEIVATLEMMYPEPLPKELYETLSRITEALKNDPEKGIGWGAEQIMEFVDQNPSLFPRRGLPQSP